MFYVLSTTFWDCLIVYQSYLIGIVSNWYRDQLGEGSTEAEPAVKPAMIERE